MTQRAKESTLLGIALQKHERVAVAVGDQRYLVACPARRDGMGKRCGCVDPNLNFCVVAKGKKSLPDKDMVEF